MLLAEDDRQKGVKSESSQKNYPPVRKITLISFSLYLLSIKGIYHGDLPPKPGQAKVQRKKSCFVQVYLALS